jgi:glutathione S-transferase
MSAITLYDLVGADDRRFSTHCWRVRPALAHKNLPFETIPFPFAGICSVRDGTYPKVPVIRDGDIWVHDS